MLGRFRLPAPCERDGGAAGQQYGDQASGAHRVSVERYYQGGKGRNDGRGKLNQHRDSIGQKHV